jgi:hypothetical protein
VWTTEGLGEGSIEGSGVGTPIAYVGASVGNVKVSEKVAIHMLYKCNRIDTRRRQHESTSRGLSSPSTYGDGSKTGGTEGTGVGITVGKALAGNVGNGVGLVKGTKDGIADGGRVA